MTTSRMLAALFTLLTVNATTCLAAGDWKVFRNGPDGWQAMAPRADIAPEFDVGKAEDAAGGPILVIRSKGLSACSGGWVRSFPVKAGTWYAFHARYEPTDVSLERRSILVRLRCHDAKGRLIGRAEYPATLPARAGDRSRTISDRYRAPDRAETCRVELLLRWTPDGQVRWSDVRLSPSEAPKPRRVKIAAVRYRPKRRTSGPEENRRLFGQMVDKAAEHKPDAIVLGEGITVVNTGKTYVDVAEPIPGPSSSWLCDLAKKHACYIVAGIYEREGKTVYNVSLLAGPDGKLVGSYRKVCLPREEITGGITPGHDYPVFDTRFGKVGMMICWDIHFPEVARHLAAAGAEVILVPIWGGNELLVRARAVENQVYVATSSYSAKIRTAVWDRRGDALDDALDYGDIAVAEVDLNERTYWDYLGDFRARITRERPRLWGE